MVRENSTGSIFWNVPQARIVSLQINGCDLFYYTGLLSNQPFNFSYSTTGFFFFWVNNKVNLIATSTAVQPHHIKKKKKSTLDLSLSSVLTSHRPHSFVILTRELAILFSSISRTDILIFEK